MNNELLRNKINKLSEKIERISDEINLIKTAVIEFQNYKRDPIKNELENAKEKIIELIDSYKAEIKEKKPILDLSNIIKTLQRIEQKQGIICITKNELKKILKNNQNTITISEKEPENTSVIITK